MDISSISGTAALMKSEQSQQAISITMMKQEAVQQNQMANMLAQSAQQATTPTSGSGSGYSFSAYV
jgi:hypothetical protein